MNLFDLLIIGGGAAGLMAACQAATSGKKVLLVEKNEVCGKKILLTGKGRCNVTNTKPWDEFSRHIHPDEGFLKSAFFAFNNLKTMEFFSNIGLPLVEERGCRVFPKSQKSHDVRDIMVAYISKYSNVSIVCGTDVVSVEKSSDDIFIISALTKWKVLELCRFYSRKVIVATGGLSYPVTGSTGVGYKIAESFGHTLIPTLPSLTALKPKSYNYNLVDLLLKNVSVTLLVDGSEVQREEGEIAFTTGGIEGSLGFRVSRRAVKALHNGQRVELVIDLKPGLSSTRLKERIQREWKKGMKLEKFLVNFLPIQAIVPFMEASEDLNPGNLPVRLKNWRFRIVDYVGYERSVVTSGGVSLKEISRKSMESKLAGGLYFAGEVIDLDGDTGGYNLQIAFTTAAVAAKSALAALS